MVDTQGSGYERVLDQLLPEILRQIEADIELGYAPKAPADERNRYMRLHIPLVDLELMDHCFGWLPSFGSTHELIAEVREYLYGK